jgi:hypothetical protein
MSRRTSVANSRRSRCRRVSRHSGTGIVGIAGSGRGSTRDAAQSAAGVSGVAELATLRLAVGNAPPARLPPVLGIGHAFRLALPARFAGLVASATLELRGRTGAVYWQELQRLRLSRCRAGGAYHLAMGICPLRLRVSGCDFRAAGCLARNAEWPYLANPVGMAPFVFGSVH